MDNLSADEIAILLKYEVKKKKHAESQAKYRNANKETIAQYNKEYYAKKRTEIEPILKKVSIPTHLPLAEIVKEVVPVSKRTRKGRKRAQVNADVIKPMYQVRKEPLAYSTINNYLKKANVLQKLFGKPILSLDAKNELKKLLNDNPNINEKKLLSEMDYINNDIQPTIEKLRAHYKNDNSFKGYLLTLTVIASHLKTLNRDVHQTLSKSAIYINKAIQDEREDNIIDKEDEGKLIDLSRDIVLKKLNELTNIEDKLIFALYTLMPARRLDWRLVKLTLSLRVKDDDDNYLILSKPKKVVFNNYKTRTAYGQQSFDITDSVLNDIIDKYISEKNVKPGEYLFHLQRDHRETINGSLFSTKVSKVFKKLYGKPISVRFLRMSHVSHFLKQNRSLKDMKDFAYKMGHSTDEQQRYKKLNSMIHE